MGPLDLYQAAVSKGDIQSDVAQLEAMERLHSLYLALTKQENEPGLIAKLFAKPKRESIPGLYFWGGVGRGKTFLMDLFFDSLPFEQKTRMHFHRFMRHVHRALTDLQGEADPLRKIALDFADKNRVLCFDEFFVSDITDAMILAGLLEVLFENGVTLVATSNVEPVNLVRKRAAAKQVFACHCADRGQYRDIERGLWDRLPTPRAGISRDLSLSSRPSSR